MAIIIKEPSIKITEASFVKLLEKLKIPDSKQVKLLLTRYDFQNKKFANLKSLNIALRTELAPAPIRWEKSLTPDHEVKNAVDGNFFTNVILVRGTTQDSAARVIERKSAGGEESSLTAQRPNEAEANSQVGGSQPGIAQKKLPEFTTTKAIADKWARRGGFLYIKISASYLTRGDIGQNGWIAKKSAPILDCFYDPHPNPVAFNVPNAD